MFNDYIWKIYLNAGGNEIVKTFESIHNDCSETSIKKYAEMIMNFHKNYNPCFNISKQIFEETNQLFTDINNSDLCYGCYSLIQLPDGEYSIEDIMRIFYNGLKNDTTDTTVFQEFCNGIVYYTLFFHILFPDIFIPYFFKWSFNVLEKIADEFSIDLPAIPNKKDYRSRLFYYSDICEALIDFREEHNMTPFELCAFLYDFAPKYIGGADSYIVKDLPAATSAFFIGTTENDLFFSSDEITPWQCSPEAKAGDFAVMYIKSPISSVDSVWRCASNGFVDPFFYYYRCAYISNRQQINRVEKSRLESDDIFKHFPLVRKNMQGINGVELLPSQYNHLMDMADSDVTRLKYTVTNTGVELMRESDVEEKLIIPFLKKLGYSENDFDRQLHIEIGNHNNMIIPDFVLLPDNTRGRQTAFAIIEAKYDIPNKAAFEDVKIQARSYARQCLARYSIIASKDKIWISAQGDDYVEDIIIAAWDEMNEADVFSTVLKMIGKNKARKS